MKIGLIIPCFNFEHKILDTLARIQRWHTDKKISLLVCVVDDGSTDSTAAVVEQYQREHSHWLNFLKLPRNQGKGAAVKKGYLFLANHGVDKILFTDCDLHYGIEILDRLIAELDAVDVVIADRSWSASSDHQAISRQASSYIFNRLTGLFTGVIFRDSQAGLKGFRAKECLPMFELAKITGFAFDVEILSMALFFRFRIKQVPVSFHQPREDIPESSVKLIRHSLLMVLELLKINLNWRRNVYRSPQLEAKVEKEIYVIRDGT